MTFPGFQYAPPNPYTETDFDNPLQGAIDSLKVPIFIGEGHESLSEVDLGVVRGSSAHIDQRIVGEDMSGRVVVSVASNGVVTRGDFDCELTKVQVRNLPIVDGAGRGTITNSRSDVNATINGLPVVVISVDGAAGIVELAQAPKLGDLVRVSYFFNRQDTLVTDDLSEQVTTDAAVVRATVGLLDVNAPTPGTATIDLHADILGPNGEVIVPANNELNFVIDGIVRQLILTPKSDYTMQQVANVISGAGVLSLTGSTFVNNHGESTLALTADHDLTIREGTANAMLGIATGQTSTRRKTFYTFNGPIVDGTNGGVTTTDPSHVVVKVDGVQVIPVSVDGATRAVTLEQAPVAGAGVSATYWFNTWQDTYDHLQHVNVTQITRVGDVPGGSHYIQETDFVLENDRVMWGTAVSVVSGLTTAGSEMFDDTQIVPTLIDNRTYLSVCVGVTSSQGDVSTTSFQLPLNPTLGNGRDTSLGKSLFQSLSNNRIGVPVNRPDVVDVYWGFGVDDALARGKVTNIKVEGSVVSLQDSVPVGATVYASFYHNMIVDMEYTITTVLPGISGVGTYTIQDSASVNVLTSTFDNNTKSAGLTGVEIVFPSGSELTPDLHFEGGAGTIFQGPVEEIVTITFSDTPNTPAKFTVAGTSPYAFIPGESDLVAMTVNGDAVLPVSGTDLDIMSGGGAGVMAHFVGMPLVYPNGVDFLVADFTIGNEDIILTVDGVEITAVLDSTVVSTTVAEMAGAINEAADGHQGVAGAGSPTTTTFELASALRSGIDDYYVGWHVVVGNAAFVITGGSVGVVIGYVASSGVVTLAAVIDGANDFTVADPYRIYNPATMPVLKGATRFNGPIDLSGGSGFDSMTIEVNGETSTLATIGPLAVASLHASVTDLAKAINDALRGVAATHTFDVPPSGGLIASLALGFAGLDVIFSVDGDGRLQVRFHLAGTDRAGYLAFVAEGSAVDDLCVLAGFDVGASGGDQTKLNISGNDVTTGSTEGIAKSYRLQVPAGSGPYNYDRLILRNRIHPGGVTQTTHNSVEQCQLLIGAGSGNIKAGLLNAEFGEAAHGGTVLAASVLGRVGFAGGTDDAGEPQVTLYDGTGAVSANNIFEFVLDGEPIRVTYANATATGTVYLLGIAAAAGDRIILETETALAANGTWGNLAAVQAANIVQAEGAGFRITSQSFHESGRVEISSGSANTILGFTEGTVAARTLVTAEVLASALNSHRAPLSISDFLWTFTTVTTPAAEFAGQALAKVVVDSVARKYLHIISAGPAATDYGTGSNITLLDATTRSWLFVGTGIDELTNAGSMGDAAVNGFFVTSSDATNGSGSTDTSLLNAGTGQDGMIGQTYRDAVTGLTFTILPRGWHDNSAGPWITYPDAATFNFRVSKEVTANANIPIRAIPGIELLVSNTSGVAVGDTAIVQTFPRGGDEPAIGDIYYVTYIYQKLDFTTAFYTRMQSIINAYGAIHPENPVSLASYLAMINGAVLVGVKQVPRAENENFADVTTYVNAITELEGVLPGHITPDIITPLKGNSTQLYQILSRSNDIQSSARYRQERTSIIGVAAGTSEAGVKSLAESLKSDRMRVVYPDMALLDVEEADGTSKEHLIDGPMLAAMLVGSVVSPNFDVASPWTKRRLVGPTQLARTLDAVQQNQLAQAGITVLDDKPPFVRVRHGLTTHLKNVLTKTPTVRLIADHVQQQSRATLDQFIGMKFIPGILSQVEGRLARMLQTLIKQQIIAIYTGLTAKSDPEDPTTANVEAYYQPVFPLLYIIMSLHLRANL